MNNLTKKQRTVLLEALELYRDMLFENLKLPSESAIREGLVNEIKETYQLTAKLKANE